MNAYKMIVIALLFIMVVSIYHLGPVITQCSHKIGDLPEINPYQTRDPAVFSIAVRAMYLIALVGIIKLLISKKKDE